MAELLKEKCVRTECEDTSVRRICFVCTGNTCRSPMAEAVANALLYEAKNKALQGIAPEVRDAIAPSTEAFSRGLYANENQPISRGACDALEEAGVPSTAGRDYRKHTAHNLTAQDVASFDLLIGMTASHAMELMMRFPQAADRIACMPQQIFDPYGGDGEVYRKCLAQITEGVKSLLGLEKNA